MLILFSVASSDCPVDLALDFIFLYLVVRDVPLGQPRLALGINVSAWTTGLVSLLEMNQNTR